MTLEGMPTKLGKERDEWILGAVLDGRADFSFADVRSDAGEKTAVFRVFRDALTIEGVRMNVSASLQQRIADVTGCMLMTAKVADLLWMQREVTLTPFTRPITSSTEAMIDNSAKIDAALSEFTAKPQGIVQTVGKHWIVDNDLASHPGKAMNYGWHFSGSNFSGLTGEVNASLQKDQAGTYVRLIQGRGTAHDPSHTDYSQICVLMSRTCLLDGSEVDIQSVLSDPSTASLGSHQGPLKVFRQPGVEEVKGMLVLPTQTVTADPDVTPVPSV